MRIRDCYQTQPDAYVRFDWHGNKMEGEFYKYNWCGDEVSPETGYVRPFDKFLRQCLIDNLQASQEFDAEDSLSESWLVICDAIVTNKYIQAPYQCAVEKFEFISEGELTTEKSNISDCRLDLLQRLYLFAKAHNKPEWLLSDIQEEYLKLVTPLHKPLRYRRTWFQKHGDKVKTIALILIFLLILA